MSGLHYLRCDCGAIWTTSSSPSDVSTIRCTAGHVWRREAVTLAQRRDGRTWRAGTTAWARHMHEQEDWLR